MLLLLTKEERKTLVKYDKKIVFIFRLLPLCAIIFTFLSLAVSYSNVRYFYILSPRRLSLRQAIVKMLGCVVDVERSARAINYVVEPCAFYSKSLKIGRLFLSLIFCCFYSVWTIFLSHTHSLSFSLILSMCMSLFPKILFLSFGTYKIWTPIGIIYI